MNQIKHCIRELIISVGLVLCVSANADTRIAVLDFELNDITSLPNTTAEIERTASFKPLLEKALNKVGEYEIIQISTKKVAIENAGLGYLYKFHDIAAALGKRAGADWIIVSQHSKPSFLYSYLMVNLVNVKASKLKAHYDIELKGNHQKVSARGIKSLAKRINKTIGN
ncbi:MAG: DUF3280 domain-containing protein [Methylococcaceae bacterium]|nr:DUF3280 domain-containing protein [Methylococcaceae bacterium]